MAFTNKHLHSSRVMTYIWTVNHYRRGIHYFNVLYRSPMAFSFTDCQHDYRDNKNLHAMMLPPSCRVTTINPRTTLSLLKTTTWLDTDLKCSLTLSKLCHIIIIYQFSGVGVVDSYFYSPMRVTINNSIQKHTVSHLGYSQYIGNFGLWQGSLSSGTHKIVVQSF